MNLDRAMAAPYQPSSDSRWLWVVFGLWISLSIHVLVLVLVALFGSWIGREIGPIQNAIPI